VEVVGDLAMATGAPDHLVADLDRPLRPYDHPGIGPILRAYCTTGSTGGCCPLLLLVGLLT
jgi:hypothetical protein